LVRRQRIGMDRYALPILVKMDANRVCGEYRAVTPLEVGFEVFDMVRRACCLQANGGEGV
jgi:hypothetical protein